MNYLYAPEVFPTEIRVRGFAFVQVLGSVGSSVAPFVTDVLVRLFIIMFFHAGGAETGNNTKSSSAL